MNNDYIKREEVLELINRWKRDDVTPHVVDYSAGWNEALEQIEVNVKEDIPAADVRSERHGHQKETVTVIINGIAHEMEDEEDTPTVEDLMKENAELKRALRKIAGIISNYTELDEWA